MHRAETSLCASCMDADLVYVMVAGALIGLFISRRLLGKVSPAAARLGHASMHKNNITMGAMPIEQLCLRCSLMR